MNTEILIVDAASPEADKIKKAAEVILDGGIVAVPTETVYGLAVNAKDKKALDRLYSIKKRDRAKPLTIQIEKAQSLKDYAFDIPAVLELMVKECWPGPLTILVQGRDGKTGLRIPDSKATLSIIKQAGVALAVTSANISGEGAVSSADDVFKLFKGEIEMVVDDKSTALGIESTVVDCTIRPFKILRRGAISEKVERIISLYG